MPKECSLHLMEVKAEPRTTGKTVQAMMELEAQRIEAALPMHCIKVVLDEKGQDISTQALATQMQHWLSSGQDVFFLIGGPDGLHSRLKANADFKMRLSSLTLPHAMVRPLLAEALYRAWSVVKNHPYHRV